MVLFNYSTKELTAKVVYYGPGLCGKTTNLQWIHEKLPIKNKGKMVSLATEADRTLFFDFLPIELGTIRGMKTRIQLYTVPGQVFYNATRRMVLKGADCVVFVVDSQEPMLDANLDAFANLRENLEANEIDADEIPTVLQYNKRDLPNALPVEVLNERLNPKGWPHFEACAKQGVGVEETLKGVTGLVFRSLATKYGGAEAAAALAGARAQRPAPKPPPRPAPPPPPPPRSAPAPLAGSSADDLLDSLEMPSPAAAAPPLEELTLPGDELSLDAAPVAPPPSIEPEPLPELALEEPSAAPTLDLDLSPPPSAAQPPELDLEDLGAISAPPSDPEPLPELTLPEPAPEPAPDLALEPAPEPLALEPLPPEPPSLDALEPVPAEPVANIAAAPEPTATAKPGVPVSVEVTASAGQTDIVIPVEVTLAEGTAKVTLNIRLTLNLKLPGR